MFQSFLGRRKSYWSGLDDQVTEYRLSSTVDILSYLQVKEQKLVGFIARYSLHLTRGAESRERAEAAGFGEEGEGVEPGHCGEVWGRHEGESQ